MSEDLIYLDYAAATPMDRRVQRAMEPFLTEYFYNPSALYEPAVKVRAAYKAAKKSLANIIGAREGELVMTAGATESINLAFSVLKKYGGNAVTSAMEHQAVLAAARQYAHSIAAVNSDGIISVSKVMGLLNDETTLVSIGLVNNELGTVQPIRLIAKELKRVREARLAKGNQRPIFLHIDASQGANQLDMSVHRLGADLMTLSAAKIYGPKQVGLLYFNNQVELSPIVLGGGQELGLRSGTENVAGVIGFATALEMAAKKRKSETNRLRELRDYMEATLRDVFPQIIISGNSKKRLSGYLHVTFPGLDGERLVYRLETVGVLVATGSACAARNGSYSHVLAAIGLTEEEANGSLRISLGRGSTKAQIKKATSLIVNEVKQEYERLSNA